MEGEEEEGEFVMYVRAPCQRVQSLTVLFRGNFADSFGEDFLGLRELGIADEFGLSSLTIPRKLLKGKTRPGLKGAEAYVFILLFHINIIDFIIE